MFAWGFVLYLVSLVTTFHIFTCSFAFHHGMHFCMFLRMNVARAPFEYCRQKAHLRELRKKSLTPHVPVGVWRHSRTPSPSTRSSFPRAARLDKAIFVVWSYGPTMCGENVHTDGKVSAQTTRCTLRMCDGGSAVSCVEPQKCVDDFRCHPPLPVMIVYLPILGSFVTGYLRCAWKHQQPERVWCRRKPMR